MIRRALGPMPAPARRDEQIGQRGPAVAERMEHAAIHAAAGKRVVAAGHPGFLQRRQAVLAGRVHAHAGLRQQNGHRPRVAPQGGKVQRRLARVLPLRAGTDRKGVPVFAFHFGPVAVVLAHRRVHIRAMRQQQRRNRRAAGVVQGNPAVVVARVGLGVCRQQDGGQPGLMIFRRVVQGALAVAVALRARVRPGRQQQRRNHRPIVQQRNGLHGQQQRREAEIVPRVQAHIRGRRQQRHHRRVVAVHGQVQRRPVVLLLNRQVHAHPPRQQKRRDGDMPAVRGQVQRRPAEIVRRVRVRPGVQVASHRGQVAVRRRVVKIQAAKRRRHRHIHRRPQLATWRGARNPGAVAAPQGQRPAVPRNRRENQRRPARNASAVFNRRAAPDHRGQSPAARGGKQRRPLRRAKPAKQNLVRRARNAGRTGAVRVHRLAGRAGRSPMRPGRNQRGGDGPSADARRVKTVGARIPGQAQRRGRVAVWRVHIRPASRVAQRAVQVAALRGLVQILAGELRRDRNVLSYSQIAIHLGGQGGFRALVAPCGQRAAGVRLRPEAHLCSVRDGRAVCQ